MNFLSDTIFYIRFKHAVKKANRYHQLTGRKYLVLRKDKDFIVKSKTEFSYLIKQKVLKTDIQTIEEIAVYIAG